MIAFTVNLPPGLARFVAESVADGSWATADDLFAHALTLARTAPVVAKPTSPDVRKTPPSGSVPVVDMTRQTFDSSSFMGELTRKLHGGKK